MSMNHMTATAVRSSRGIYPSWITKARATRRRASGAARPQAPPAASGRDPADAPATERDPACDGRHALKGEVQANQLRGGETGRASGNWRRHRVRGRELDLPH